MFRLSSLILFSLIFHLWTQRALGFNLEPNLPVIKRGEPNSYFGFSVAQHLTHDRQPWILVGSPLAQNLQPNTSRSGALFKCPLTLVEKECTQVVTDGKRNPILKSYDLTIGSDNLYPPSNDEIKDGQWLGVNVKSSGTEGGKVMVCAHRYIHSGPDFRWGLGLCHFLDADLAYSQTLEPCRNKQRQGLEDFGFCQVGTSGALLGDDSALMGAPGAYTCRGTFYSISVSDDYLNKDREQYHTPFGSSSPVEKYSYLGTSVVGGHFHSPDYYSYATGAPKAANGSGQVLFFSKNSNEVLKAEGVLTGEGFAFSFGYELASLDINGDGKTDLAVGAPFYMDPKVGGDSGAVYIYLNSPSGFNSESQFTKISGGHESRFGIALSSVGDLNHDKYEDLAVGAPFEDEGRGAVYIFLGSKDGIVKEPSQIIRASVFYPRVRTFGSSLSGGMDLDLNSYPDLLVGAYESSTVVLLRSRPIIDITTDVRGNLTGVDPTVPGCPEDPTAPTTCFLTCFEIREAAKVLVASLGVKYTLIAEPDRKYSRVSFARGLRDKNHTVQETIYVRRSGQKEHCIQELVYLKKDITDILTPVSFLLSYTLDQRTPPYLPNVELPSIQNYPILNQQEALRPFQAFFEKDCGSNEKCESDLYLTVSTDLEEDPSGRLFLVLGRGREMVINVTYRNFGEPAYQAMLYLEHPKSMPFIAQALNGGSLLGCTPASSTLVACEIGNPFKDKGISDSVALRFDASLLKDIETRLDFTIWTNSTSLESDPENNNISLVVTVVKRAELSLRWVSKPKEVSYSGVIRGESAMHNLSDIGSKVVHTYEVINDGPSSASHFNLHILWPHQVGNNGSSKEGKWLLYLEKVEVEGDGECFVPPTSLNVLRLPPTDMSGNKVFKHMRRKRDVEEAIVSPQIVIGPDGKKSKVVIMDCEKGSAICVKFTCLIRSLLPNESANVMITSRLWNSTLVEDYPGVDEVLIYSKAALKIDDENRQDPANDIASAFTLATPDLKLKVDAKGVSWWIYVLAILLGILLFLLIVFCLYRWGFFIRRRPQPTHTASILKS